MVPKVKEVRQTSVNILTTNVGGLRHKACDLKNKIKYFQSIKFSVQESHFAKKGKFVMEKYIIFEAIRNFKKIKGVLCLVYMWFETYVGEGVL